MNSHWEYLRTLVGRGQRGSGTGRRRGLIILIDMVKTSRLREQCYGQSHQKGSRAQGDWGPAAEMVQKPPFLSQQFGQTWCLAIWSHGELGRPIMIFAGIRTEETEIDPDVCQNKAKINSSDLREGNS